MIPKIIHYCWFGGGEMPQLAKDCIASWHKFMPDWEFKLWNENNFDVSLMPYTKEAYDSKIYAFVSDVARLKALKDEGGLYMDVDFEVLKPFDDLMCDNKAFAGVEGSKHSPVMMGVCASEKDGEWVSEMLEAYSGRHFIIDGKPDLTPNVTFLTRVMAKNGLVQDGKEQYYKDLHIYPVDYFSPVLTTGENVRSQNTYCETKKLNSWPKARSIKSVILSILGHKNKVRIIKLKRKLFG